MIRALSAPMSPGLIRIPSSPFGPINLSMRWAMANGTILALRLGAEIPDLNTEDEVVWRNAATGEELAQPAALPAMTSGTMVQPSYRGDIFYPGAAGSLYKLQPTPIRR